MLRKSSNIFVKLVSYHIHIQTYLIHLTPIMDSAYLSSTLPKTSTEVHISFLVCIYSSSIDQSSSIL